MSHKCNNCFIGDTMTTKQILKAKGLIPNSKQHSQMLYFGFVCLWVTLVAVIFS